MFLNAASTMAKTRLHAVPVTDPHFDSVVLLLPFNDADAATTTTDESNSAHSPTFAGNAETDTAQFKFGTAASYFDGAGGDKITFASHADFNFGTDDFTIEMWCRFADITDINIIAWDGAYSSSIYCDANTHMAWYSDSNIIQGTTAVVINEWTHVALTRTAGTFELFTNGASQGTSTTARTFTQSEIRIGSGDINGMNGWLDEVRITKGVSRYSGSFVPPRGAYPIAGDTPWPDVDAWSLDTVPVEYNGAFTDIVGCVWNDDGTRLYVTGDTGSNSTLYYNSPDYSPAYVPVDDTSPTSTNFNRGSNRAREITWDGDGTNIFVANFGSNNITKHANSGTAYNPSTDDISATVSQSFGITAIRSIDISPDGTIIWAVTNSTGRDIFEINMSTPYDLTSASLGSEYSPSEGDMLCMKFSPDGFKYYALGLDNILYEYTVSTQWDISTSSYASRSLDVSNTRSPICFDVSSDATNLVVGFFDVDSADAELATYTT